MRITAGMKLSVLLGSLLFATVLLPAQHRDLTKLPGKDFPIVGGNLANLRHSTLTKIDKSNVDKLGGAWMVHVAEGQGLWMQATPVVVDGIMYMATGHVTARNARTGELIWQYPKGELSRGGGPVGGPENVFNRGVAVADGKVFSAAYGATLIALDQKTGELLWNTPLQNPAPEGRGRGRGFSPAPAIYYDGLVYMGVAGGEQGVRGQIGAYDAKTGKEVWKFWTVPGPGEFGHDTWEGESWKTGGAPVWTHPAIDPELGMLYVPAGNAWPDTNGTERGGDNLFSVSILALDLKTGQRKWHYQEVHHDMWDYDAPATPILADVTYQGRPRKILMHGGKTGMMYILDRTNGTPLIGIEEKPVPQLPEQKTAATQPYPIGDTFVPTCPQPGAVPDGLQSGCVFTPFLNDVVVVAPGTNGGLAWAPMTYSPETKWIYVCGTVQSSGYSLRGFGGLAGRGRQPQGGTVTAMDPLTNKIVWQQHLPFPCGGGSGLLSTASGLLFHGQSDGFLVARDAKTGEVLWKFQTGAGADAPVATYEVDGEQYVAILAGGNQYLNTQFGDNLWAFKIGGTVPPLPAPRAPGPQPLPTAVSLSTDILSQYAGTYAAEQGLEIHFTVENGRLMLQLGNNPNKQPLLAESETSFFFQNQAPNQRIEFIKDANGVVTGVQRRQIMNGVTQRFTKR